MDKKFTVAIIGMGNRGRVYTREMQKHPDKYEVVAICDRDETRIDDAKNDFGIKEEQVTRHENDFFAKKRADICIVATQDQDHVRHAIKALELGYDVLCEKPISDREEECRRLLEAQKKYGGKVFVCHVLRYAPAFVKLKELIDSKVIGDIVMIDHLEQVFYFHQAHSFVRGNWRRREDTSPMIIAKSCHDLDLLQWYIGSECDTVSSIGDLRFFKKENQPEGASDRCTDCKYVDTCPYSAVSGYVTKKCWGHTDLITKVRPLTSTAVIEGLKTSPYGRCVFACDNTVVDNQIVMMRFKNGVTANFRMTGFTRDHGRIIKVYGTYGEIDFDSHNEFIDVRVFGKETVRYNTKDIIENGYGHGGGDAGIVKGLYEMLTGQKSELTTLAASVESHLMGFAAERSRLTGGDVIKIEH
jgi:predicted dehydrogenase